MRWRPCLFTNLLLLELLLLPRSSKTVERCHPICRLTTLRHHDKCNFVFMTTLSQREGVGASVTSACRQVCTVQGEVYKMNRKRKADCGSVATMYGCSTSASSLQSPAWASNTTGTKRTPVSLHRRSMWWNAFLWFSHSAKLCTGSHMFPEGSLATNQAYPFASEGTGFSHGRGGLPSRIVRCWQADNTH